MTPTWRIDLFAAPSDSVLMVVKHLQGLAFQVVEHHDVSTDNVSKSLSEKPDLLLLISESEDFDACLELIRSIRSIKALLPVLHLHSEAHFSYRVQSLQAGADDVLSMPYAVEEMDARLAALLRRSSSQDLIDGSILRYADLALNTDNRELTRANCTEKLTVKEYDLLMFLLQRHGQVMPRKTILQAIWGQSWSGDDNLLEVYIRYLRKKIERPGHNKLLQTVRGVGYMLK